MLHKLTIDSDSHRGRVPCLALAAPLAVIALTTLAEASFAQEASPTPIAMQPVTWPVTDSSLLLAFTITTFIFALIAMSLLLLYIQRAQARFYAVFEALGRAGRNVRVTSTTPFATAHQDGLAAAGETEATHLTITGPGTVLVGVVSEPFVATLPGGIPADTATWTATPATAVVVQPVAADSTARVTVLPAVTGAFTLRAEVAGSPSMNGEVQAAAVSSQPDSVDLPFIGRGWGSILIVIILVAAIIVLALAGVLSGEAVAPIIAALAGYVFGATRSTTSDQAGRTSTANNSE